MNESWFYTNCFAVKDRKAFKAFCQEYGLNVMEENELVGCYSSGCGLPEIFPGVDDEVAFLRVLATHLQDGHVAVLVDASVTDREYSDASWQITYAVNAQGDIRILNPVDIFEDARELGQHITDLQDMCSVGTRGRIRRSSLRPRAQLHLLLPRGAVEVLASALCTLLKETLGPDRWDPGAWTSSERECLAQLAWLANKYALTPAGMTVELRKAMGLALGIRERTLADQFVSYATRCPYCGSARGLNVIEVTLSSQGDTALRVDVPLHPDGFDLSGSADSSGHKDWSTEDERVRCSSCGTEFDLSDLTF